MRPQNLVLLQLICLVAACAPSSPEITGAWLRAAPDGSALRVAYLDVSNPGPDDWITGARSDAHETASLHETLIESGVSRMRRRDRIEIQSGATLSFRPGGLHIMLGPPTRDLTAGDTVRLALTLESGRIVAADAVVSRQQP